MSQAAQDAVLAAPPVSIAAGITFFGYTPEVIIQVLTIAYLGFLVLHYAPKAFDSVVSTARRLSVWWASR